MFSLKKLLKKSEMHLSDPVSSEADEIPCGINPSIAENITVLRCLFGESFDLIIKETLISGVKAAFVVLDGMYDNLLVSQAVVNPVLKIRIESPDPQKIFKLAAEYKATECDSQEVSDMSDAVDRLLSGCILLFVDGVNKCLIFSVQGYPKKSIDPPESETQEQGSHEGFADMYKDNVTLVRRRLKSPYIRFETLTAGETSNTTLCVCYHSKRADPKIVSSVKSKLQTASLDIVPGAGAIRPFLESKRPSFFTSVGTTERPDVFAAKLSEGRVGIIVDGTPYALIVPYLFIENFHSLDDYLSRPYYTLMSRILKIICFFTAVLLPGAYVAAGTYHQEIFPPDVISGIASSLQNTPFPLVIEALVIHLIYEIVREAGLRMPKSMGHAVSIVGALVIGDAAVTAGLISAPMLIVVALTAICTAVIFPLQQPASVLRLIFIFAGGFFGFYGIILGFSVIVINLCSVSSFGVPFTSPVSPFDVYGSRDSIIFAGWRKTGSRFMQIQKLRGSDANGNKS
ncbi:MAG: spore germination protein [Clostridiales bacterium]|nr:spore germination protein [Clostridiales bacterium]